MPTPPYVTVNPESRAARWTGVPSAVYKLDLDGLAALEERDKKLAIAKILGWMADVDNSDAWVLTPSTFHFATNPQGVDGTNGVDEIDNEDVKGTCIGQCMMPIRYSAIGGENSRRCLLTCADGAPFEERTSTTAGEEWTVFSNAEFYHKHDKRRSYNELCQVLTDTAGVDGPVVISYF